MSQVDEMFRQIMSDEYGTHSNETPDYFLWKFNDTELAPVRAEVEKAKSFTFEDARHTLVGQIENEYRLSECEQHVLRLVSPLVNEYDRQAQKAKEYSNLGGNIENTEWSMQSLWVNFQRKTEFNPPHSHTGLYSFVLWLDIPYTMEEEMEVAPGTKANDGCQAGKFYFLHSGQSQIYMTKLPADKTWNGTMVIFPSTTMHGVNPFFSSDDYRITVAGNLVLKEVGV